MQFDLSFFSESEKKQRQEAVDFVRNNSAVLCERFASINNSPTVQRPISIFMAGSPGAGKTELSKNLITIMVAMLKTSLPVRIDPDDIRPHLPHYNGQNSYVVHSAASLAVAKILDCVLKHRQNFILDTTFAGFETAKKNVERCLKHERPVLLFYVFKEPEIAWKFTKARELTEGRLVPKEVFIEAFFTARDNVNQIKREFGQFVILNYYHADFTKKAYDMRAGLSSIDEVLNFRYSKEDLREILK